MPFLTIFTPTYNRAGLLPRLYKSLKSQKSKDFEWIIVDDGSNDGTEELVDKWLKEKNKFNIIYKKTKNGGKHRAINLGVKLARGKMFFIVDSDDYLPDDAVKFIKQNEAALPKGFAGLSGRLIIEPLEGGGSFVGTFRDGVASVDGTTLERKKNGITGDQAEVFYTEILREFPFPTFKDERFMEEAVVWNRIARAGFRIRWFEKPIYVCEYRSDGLSASARENHKRSPRGYRLYVGEFIKSRAPFKERAHLALYYLAFRLGLK